MTAHDTDFVQAALAGRLDDAERLRAQAGGWPSDGSDDARALALLAGIVQHAHRKDWGAARAALPSDRPAEWMDWSQLTSRLDALEEAERLKRAGDVDGALALLRQAADLPAGPLLADVLTELGTVQLLVGERDAAVHELERALTIRPTHPRALTNRGNVFLEDGQLDEATARYQSALKDNPEYAPARHNLGVTLRRQGKFAASIRELRRAQRHTVKQAREAQRLRPRRSSGGTADGEPKRRNRLLVVVGAAVALLVWWVWIR